MAAPSGISWGSVVNSGTSRAARLGIYTSLSNTNTTTTVSVQVWLWTRYHSTDNDNDTYFNWNATSASSLVASNASVSTTNTEWSTSNQVHLYSTSKSYTRGTSATTYNCAAKITGLDYIAATVSTSKSFTIPAKPSYAVTYNANGGSGAPSAQTKWYGTDLTLSTTIPTRTGYTFKGWATSASGSVAYDPGDDYTGNAALTLYAVWQVNTYDVTYDANGGTGAPAKQTKTYGTNLTLSSTKPTRENYNFLGWGISATATTVSYASGATYSTNAPITLYAVWELAYVVPTITNFTVTRCLSSGTANDYGEYAKVEFAWETCQLLGTNNVSSIVIEWKEQTATTYANKVTVSASGISGTVSKVIGSGALSTDNVYNVRVTVTDNLDGYSDPMRSLPKAAFAMDALAGGGGVAFGKPAETEGVAEFEFDVQMNNALDVGGNATFNNCSEFKTAYGGGLDSTVNIVTFNEVGGGRAVYTTSNGTGILKILLPQDFNKQMICFDVEIFSYTSQSIVTYSFAGQLAKNDSTGVYNWSSRAYNVQGNTLSTSSNLANLPINFGRHSSKAAVSIGTSTTSWGHCCVTVRNLKVWYSQQQPTYWEDSWQIALDTSALDEIKYTDSDPMGMVLKTMGDKKKLWENASPTSRFDPQNISKDLSEYNMFMVRARYSTSSAREFGMIVEKNIDSNIFVVHYDNLAGYRFIKFTDSQIQFGKTVFAMTDNHNTYCIPTRIYGIKGVS